MSGVIYPTFLFIFVRVGLILHSTYHAGDVARRGALDPVDASISRVDHMRRGSHASITSVKDFMLYPMYYSLEISWLGICKA